MQNYDHLVHFDAHKQILTIYRHHEDGSRVLFTEVDLTNYQGSDPSRSFKDLAAMLGENILLDSPAARQVFRL